MLISKDWRASQRTSVGGVKDKSGEILTDKDSILERWEEFYEDLYHDLSPDIDINDSEEEEIPPIIQSEVRKAIEDLKIGKSPGLDNIYSEYMRRTPNECFDSFISSNPKYR